MGGLALRAVSLGLAAAVAAVFAPVASQAAPYVVGHCQLTVPADWVASKTRIARPDKKLWASLLEAPTSAEIINLELGLKATKVSEDARQVVLLSTASGSGMTNKQYHVVTKTSPSCLADSVSMNGFDDNAAKQIGQTVVMKK